MSQKKYLFDLKWQSEEIVIVTCEWVSEINWLLLFSCHLRWKRKFCLCAELAMHEKRKYVHPTIAAIEKERKTPLRREWENISWGKKKNNRLFNIQNDERTYNVHCVIASWLQTACSTDNHTWTLNMINVHVLNAHRYARIHFRETQTEFINVRLKLISGKKRKKKWQRRAKRTHLSQYHVPMWMANADCWICAAHIIWFS